MRIFYREGKEYWSLIVVAKALLTNLIFLQGWLTYETLPINEEDLLMKEHQNWEYYY